MKSTGCLIIGFAFCIATTYATTTSVKLLTNTLKSLGKVTDIDDGALSITDEAGKQHWALVVQFKGDDKVWICELYRDIAKVNKQGLEGIVGGCRHVTKAQALAGKHKVHIYNFGNTNTTPQQLLKKAASISVSQIYRYFLRNSQHWVLKLLQALNMDTVSHNVHAFLEKKAGPHWFLSKVVKSL